MLFRFLCSIKRLLSTRFIPLGYGEINGGHMPSKDTQFKVGGPGGPGRKLGSRNKLTTQFVDDLANEWDQRGCQALQDLSSKDLVTACVSILPRDLLVNVNQDQVRWVISAAPELTQEEWELEYGPKKLAEVEVIK